MFREMRRKKQQLSESDCEKVLAAVKSGVLALCGDNGYPYTVPMNFVYEDNKFYFHSAKQGHKIDALTNSPKASFCAVSRDIVLPLEYTTDYVSVIAFGNVRILNGSDAEHAIEKLAKRYAPHDDEGRNAEINRYADKFYVLELSAEHISGKRGLKTSGLF